MATQFAQAPRLVDAASASRNRQAQAAIADKGTWYNITEASLVATPNLKGRFVDVLNAIEDFRSAYEAALRHASLVPAGHSVIFTKGKFGWSIGIVPTRDRAPSTRNAPAISDIA